MFLETEHHILDFHGMRSPSSETNTLYAAVLESTLRPRGGRELFGQFATPNESSSEEIQKATGSTGLLTVRESFLFRLKEAYDGPFFERALQKRKGGKHISEFIYLRLCAPEKNIFSNYDEARQHLQKLWRTGNKAKDHFSNAMQLLSIFRWYMQKLELQSNMELLYGILVLESNVLAYLKLYPW